MITDDIRSGENDQLEFKENPNKDSQRWLKTVVAFANCRGGRIIFGVADDRRLIGLQGDVFAMRDSIADAVASACTPVIPVDISMTTIDGKPLIVLEIHEGEKPPYYLKSQGERNGVFVRYDATTRIADELCLKELNVNGSGRGFDAMECRGLKVTAEDITKLCQKLYASAQENALTEESRKMIRPVTPAQLTKWGVLLERNNRYLATNAYALLQGDDHLQTVVKCAVFKGETRTHFIDRREFCGAVQEQVDEAFKYVLSKINCGAYFGESVHRRDVYEIPPSAIREIIVNAVVHRSYVNGEESPITIALYDDRLEVTSPGKLPHGVTIAKMLEGCSECRNTVLARAFSYMGLIEDWGSGIPRICNELRNAGLAELEISPWPNAVRITIYRNVKKNAEFQIPRGEAWEQGFLIQEPYVDYASKQADIDNEQGNIIKKQVDIQNSKVDYDYKNAYFHKKSVDIPSNNTRNNATKVDIQNKKDLFLRMVKGKLSSTVFSHVAMMAGSFWEKPFFKRSEVVGVLNMSATGASKLLSTLLTQNVLSSVSGHGKGAYRFTMSNGTCSEGKN